jgi:hypothetical protein
MITTAMLFAAIVAVESGGNCYAIGDGGKAVGAAQIWEVVVKDCNQISKTKHFTLNDRYSIQKSMEMFVIYTDHYGKRYGCTPEVRAKIWNGGPGGMKMEKTVKYWQKVKAKLK